MVHYLLYGVVFGLMTAVAEPVPTFSANSYHDGLSCRNHRMLSAACCLEHALNVISVSKRYSLLESVWFDAINGTNHSYVATTSDPNNFAELARKAANLFDTHYLIWKVGPGINLKVFKMDDKRFGMSVIKDIYPLKQDERTFGIGKRRIMMALLPIMYKLGVITTLLVALTVITLKGLTIGVILLMLSFGGLVSKLKQHHHSDHDHDHHWPNKDIHIHVHPFSNKEQHYLSGGYPWHRNGDESDDQVTTAATATPWSYLPPFMTH